jgi:hypothetical protein
MRQGAERLAIQEMRGQMMVKRFEYSEKAATPNRFSDPSEPPAERDWFREAYAFSKAELASRPALLLVAGLVVGGLAGWMIKRR